MVLSVDDDREIHSGTEAGIRKVEWRGRGQGPEDGWGDGSGLYMF